MCHHYTASHSSISVDCADHTKQIKAVFGYQITWYIQLPLHLKWAGSQSRTSMRLFYLQQAKHISQ